MTIILCASAFAQKPDAKPVSSTVPIVTAGTTSITSPSATPDPLTLAKEEVDEIEALLTDSAYIKRAGERAKKLYDDKRVSDELHLLAEFALQSAAKQQDDTNKKINQWVGKVQQRTGCNDCEVDLEKRRLVKPEKKTEAVKP